MDLVGLRLYKKQHINLYKKEGADFIYITIYNFDPITRNSSIHFQLNIVTSFFMSGLNCFPCNGGARISRSCACQNCPASKYG
jgi:hypothetical protein